PAAVEAVDGRGAAEAVGHADQVRGALGGARAWLLSGRKLGGRQAGAAGGEQKDGEGERSHFLRWRGTAASISTSAAARAERATDGSPRTRPVEITPSARSWSWMARPYASFTPRRSSSAL